MKELLPLVESAAYNDVEDELKNLAIRLWQDMLYNHAKDINVYGFPHQGTGSLLQKALKSDGIANFDKTVLLEDNARLLLMAIRHNNQKRGTWALTTFLRCVWGGEFRVHQLWQLKDGEYPKKLRSERDIRRYMELDTSGTAPAMDDYFLTSRLMLELGAKSAKLPFPENIKEQTRGVLPARLFIDSVKRVIDVGVSLGTATCIHTKKVIRLHFEARKPIYSLCLGIASVAHSRKVVYLGCEVNKLPYSLYIGAANVAHSRKVIRLNASVEQGT